MDKKTEGILGELKASLMALYGDSLAHLALFGSRARGDAAPDSDIDVLVVLKGMKNPVEEIGRTGDIVTELSLKYDTVVSCVFMDVDRWSTRNGPLLRNIRREGIPV
jgi:predicted nucleotidyltransferase